MQAQKTELLQTFAARLKAEMARRGVTLQQVAIACHVATSTVGAWTQGKNWPQVELQPTLAEFLGVSIGFLIHGLPATEALEDPADENGGSVMEEPGAYVKKRSLGAGEARRLDRSSGEMVNPRHKPVLNPTPQDCRDYFEQYLARAESELGGIGYAWRLLQKHFPLDEFEPSPPKKDIP